MGEIDFDKMVSKMMHIEYVEFIKRDVDTSGRRSIVVEPMLIRIITEKYEHGSTFDRTYKTETRISPNNLINGGNDLSYKWLMEKLEDDAAISPEHIASMYMEYENPNAFQIFIHLKDSSKNNIRIDGKTCSLKDIVNMIEYSYSE